ncbi:MAG: IS200/IS605 family transposase [Thermomicrobiales bacterium]
MSYWRTFYHLVWSTKYREPMLTPERMAMVQQAFRVVAKDMGAYTHAIGGMPDHVHVAVSIPPSIAVAAYVQRLKGSSSRYLTKQITLPGIEGFAWQEHYGVTTFGERSLDAVVGYLERQADHHATDDIWQAFELLPSPQSLRPAARRPEES